MMAWGQTHLAGVALALLVAGAHHLVVDPDVDALASVPTLANLILYHRNCNMLQNFGPQLGSFGSSCREEG